MRRRALPAVALALLTAAAAPAPADAFKDVGYWVEFQLEGGYRWSEHRTFGGEWDESTVGVNFTVNGEVDEVVFRDGNVFDKTGSGTTEGFAGGGLELKEGGESRPSRTGTCLTADQDSIDIRGASMLADKYREGEPFPLDDQAHLFLRPFDDFSIPFVDCPDIGAKLTSVALGGKRPTADFEPDGFLRGGNHQFDMPFELPKDIIGMGYIEQLIPARTFTGDDCPTRFDLDTLECKLEFSGKIILRKAWEKEVVATDGPQPPTPPASSAPPKGSLEARRDAPRVPARKPTSAKARIERAKATFRQSCAAACTGRAQLFPAGAGARAAAKVRPLATARFALRAGTTKVVTLRLSAKARKALRRARGGRLVVTTTSGGQTTTTTLRVRG